MYESFFGLSANPFQLKPDPHFFFASTGHKSAMKYLEYGLAREEGFIVITGEVGAGKTTLMRNLFSRLETDKFCAAQIVNTTLDANDILRTVAAAFHIPFEGADKATLLNRIELFLLLCARQQKRALLVVDEAQNLPVQAVEELRMLSNFQNADKCLLQTFLLGQPEFRKTMLSPGMEQLRQRVIASYHLGPLTAAETRSYIEHRLRTAGWTNSPSLNDDAFHAIHIFAGGIPRRINTLCDRLFLMGFLEEIRSFKKDEIATVIADIQREFSLPPT